MVSAVAVLTPDEHSSLKLNRQQQDLSHCRDKHMVALTAAEFPQAGGSFPILFVQDPDSGEFRSIGLLGLQPGQNLMVEDNRWLASYMPLSLRNYPFLLVSGNDGDQEHQAIGVDTNSPNLSQTEGEPLFDDTGEPSPLLEQIRDQLAQTHQQATVTSHLLNELAQHKVFKPQHINIKQPDGSTQTVEGFYCISQQKLNELDAETFIRWRDQGYLPAIYAHLASLNTVHELVKRLHQD
ncbi:hypothetical protein HMF8227_00245 [Saliniradius amylolyticus]|uniref:SapC family protein n=1 Tax=Saliniradius amylolyticus TaxID=2183582 RepID=A0A2S2DZH2_9ALTE|nr:SapC family protein [Saliniradius amylolyticus]AWL10753.1 hypothetical protein HMF8227_00245 [Saliniradius amylolyticus]